MWHLYTYVLQRATATWHTFWKDFFDFRGPAMPTREIYVSKTNENGNIVRAGKQRDFHRKWNEKKERARENKHKRRTLIIHSQPIRCAYLSIFTSFNAMRYQRIQFEQVAKQMMTTSSAKIKKFEIPFWFEQIAHEKFEYWKYWMGWLDEINEQFVHFGLYRSVLSLLLFLMSFSIATYHIPLAYYHWYEWSNQDVEHFW